MADLLGILGGGLNAIGTLRSKVAEPGLRLRNKLLGELQQELEQAREQRDLLRQQAQASERVSAYRNQFAAMGPAGATVAAAVGPLLQSTDPNVVAQGQAQLNEFYRRRSPEYRQALALGGAQLEAAQAAAANARAIGPLQQQAEIALAEQRRAAAAAQEAKRALAERGLVTDEEYRQNSRWLAQIEAPVQVQDAVQQAEAALATGDSLGTLAAVIKLAKVLDPTSVVREGEVTTVQGGIGVAEQLINNYNRIFGKGFTPTGVQAYRRVLKATALPVLRRGVKITEELRNRSLELGINPDRVTSGIGWDNDYATSYGLD